MLILPQEIGHIETTRQRFKTNRKPAGDFVAKPRGHVEVIGGNILSDLA